MKAAPEICRYGLKTPPGLIRFKRGALVPQSRQEVLRDLLETVRKRLTAGHRVEGRILAHLLEQLGNKQDAEIRALIENLIAFFSDPEIPFVPSKYQAWAANRAESLAELLKRVDQTLAEMNGKKEAND